jgi:sRNA-binding regulator protein Hfq
MKKLLFYILVILLASNFMCFQNIGPTHKMKNPDSIYKKLEMFYIAERGAVNSHINVYKLIGDKRCSFKSGIYAFSLTGPHFPRRLFMFYNSKICIFKSKGAFNATGVLEEFKEYVMFLNISESDRIKYLKAISTYLQEELGKTYGADITKD